MQLQIVIRFSQVIQKQDRALPSSKELFQSQDLTTVPERISLQEPNLGQRVENGAAGLQPFDLLIDVLDRVAELGIFWTKKPYNPVRASNDPPRRIWVRPAIPVRALVVAEVTPSFWLISFSFRQRCSFQSSFNHSPVFSRQLWCTCTK